MLEVKVKDNSRWSSITALGGKHFTKNDPVFVSEDLAGQVADNPFLEVVAVLEKEVPEVEVLEVDDGGGLEDMKVPELKLLAKDLEIKGFSKMKKAELVAAIEAVPVEEPEAPKPEVPDLEIPELEVPDLEVPEDGEGSGEDNSSEETEDVKSKSSEED